jgi:hypothetical protein
MSKNLANYRQLELRLWMTRWSNEGKESAEEDAIFDDMDDVWMALSEDERALLESEGPRCWPTDSDSMPPELVRALYTLDSPPWTYEGFQSPAEAIVSEDAA